MKEHPILFSGPMVRAILDGRKTQTRRIVGNQGKGWNSADYELRELYSGRAIFDASRKPKRHELLMPTFGVNCPYGQPGDRLWVRETWTEQHPLVLQDGRYSQDGRAGIPGPPEVNYRTIYRADGEPLQVWRRDDNQYPYFTCAVPADKVAAEHPTVCSNFTRDGKAIHWTPSIYMPRWASRITLEVTGVRVERLQSITYIECVAEGTPYDRGFEDPRERFPILWNSINAKRAPWASNPFVWVIEFKRI